MLVLLAERLLPDRVRPTQGSDSAREFAFSMRVRSGGAADGKSVEMAGLRHLKGVFLVEIDRGGRIVPQSRWRRSLLPGMS